jgi:aryl-alcohol dehydrogenase-like predicted oxidoreductase
MMELREPPRRFDARQGPVSRGLSEAGLETIRRPFGRKGCTAAQLALAWVLAQGNDIVPIPGTKRRSYLEDNVGALEVRLTPEDLALINTILPPGGAAGTRYPESGMQVVNR